MFGTETIGIATAIALQYFGCEQVMICDYSDFRLEKARNLGFLVSNNEKENLKANSIDHFGEVVSALDMTADVDIFIDAAGATILLKPTRVWARWILVW